MTSKTYPIRCHVCGDEFDLEAEFLSGLPSTADGRLLGTCNMRDHTTHTRAEIKASYFRQIAAQRER